ncbi:MAG: metallophosphoesterase family protein [Gammaproteobacteria bacterium]|nr:metallophosphoesterase family protein [Gammaproteobacteria bacterium]
MQDHGRAELYRLLEPRVGRLHIDQRLGVEADREHLVFGQGRNFFHLENWYSIHALIRCSLRLVGMHGRGRRNARRIDVRRNEVMLPRLPETFDGFTILQLSDMHLDMDEAFPGIVSERVRDLEYDLCVLTGDFRYLTAGPIEGALAGMRRLRANLAGEVYGILGNHDSIRMAPVLEEMGVRMLLNESVVLRRGDSRLHLAGIDDPHYYRADNFERARAGIPSNAVSLLLAHSPEVYRQAAHAGFDLMLCGHTHGGQICLPGGVPLMLNARCPRRVCRGAWRYHGMQGYTSAGTGSSVVDVRLNNRPEVTLHRLSKR